MAFYLIILFRFVTMTNYTVYKKILKSLKSKVSTSCSYIWKAIKSCFCRSHEKLVLC